MSCCVPFCKSSRKKNAGISFHEFPCNDDLYQQWLRRIARKDFIPNDKSNSSAVCSVHFTPEDFIQGLKIKRLRRDAVPTIFPMYPPYALFPAPNNRRSLVDSNHLKRPSSRKNESKNSRQEADKSVSLNSKMNIANNTAPIQHNTGRVFPMREAQKDPVDNSNVLLSLNNLEKVSVEKYGTKNSTKEVGLRVSLNSDVTSTNNNLLKQPNMGGNMVHALTINGDKKDSPISINSHSLSNINQVEIPVEEGWEDENLTEIDSPSIAFNSNLIFTNSNSPKKPCALQALTINKPKKDSTVTNNSNCEKIPFKDRREIDNSTEIEAFDSDMTSATNNSQKQPNAVRALKINEGKKDSSVSNSNKLISNLSNVKTSFKEGHESKNSTEREGTDIAIDSDITSTNKSSPKQPVHVLTINNRRSLVSLTEVKGLVIRKNENSIEHNIAGITFDSVSLNHLKGLPISIKETEKASIGTTNSDMTSTNNSPKQSRVVYTGSDSKKYLLSPNNCLSLVSSNCLKSPSIMVNETLTEIVDANNHHSFASLIHKKRLGTLEDPIVNSIKEVPIGIAMDSDGTRTNNSRRKKECENCVCASNSKTSLLHTDLLEKRGKIKNLRSLLWTNTQKMKKMQEKIDKLEKKVSVYESNNHETLRKINTLKENCPQSSFIADQLDNFFKKRPKFQESTIRECLLWYACSPEGYDYVRKNKLMVLPCRTTLQRYVDSDEMDTGHPNFCLTESPAKLPTEE